MWQALTKRVEHREVLRAYYLSQQRFMPGHSQPLNLQIKETVYPIILLFLPEGRKMTGW